MRRRGECNGSCVEKPVDSQDSVCESCAESEVVMKRRGYRDEMLTRNCHSTWQEVTAMV
ncbi:hypothetical protein COEREDRAFT_81344 [Coemansia reversa NRRL 1564]|uniref:Uncharacterized protein n=1 Tax=Coemansia reversa (strain ATCC 12441 / NRRL 1564) TaxID=763665 RepID=A0A2G5BBK8_COERN|nr:hypothetical protein COEREDRAFT_81344 [Coemansia reversa NRRL 1564]|eukprot:PIA16390.1 hypothetical protein COEREDRAFT_81344 [Coemansia reversa NRRL 1564]